MPKKSLLKKGDVVLVPFIFTDLVGQKVRPAIVVSDGVLENHVLLVFLSSRVKGKVGKFELDIKKTDHGFAETGLKVTSRVKVHKLTALDIKVVLARLGNVTPVMRERIDNLLVSILGIS